MAYAKEAADVSTEQQLPTLDFAHNHYGQPDVAMFDFTSIFHAEHASRVVERHGRRLLIGLLGDSLLEVSVQSLWEITAIIGLQLCLHKKCFLLQYQLLTPALTL